MVALLLFGAMTLDVQAQGPVVTADSVSPSLGSGLSQSFALQYSDSAGAASLQSVWAWFTTTGAANACLTYYDRAANLVNLYNDAGTTFVSAAPGAATTLQNSQCSINAAATTVLLSGNTLTLTLPVTFKVAFSGSKNILMYGGDVSGANSGWQQRGAWTVSSASGVPTSDSATPSSGSGMTQSFALQYSDSAGAANLQSVWVWFNATFANTAANSCMLYYDRAANQFSLLNDAGSDWMAGTSGSNFTLQNSQCSLNLAATSVTLNGSTLTLNLPMTFMPGFAGAKNIFMYAGDVAGPNSGWQQRGSWSITSASGLPTADSVTPSSGSGATQNFALQYSDSAGAANLQSVWVWFNATFANTAANSCMLSYDRAVNQLNLLNDAGSAWTWSTPGAATTLQNSQCALNMAATSVTLNGNTLTLNLAMTFKPVYSGTKNIYMYAGDISGPSSGWQQRGSWTAPSVSGLPTADSVTPSSGLGASQTFALQYSDSAGAANLQSVWVWFNATFANTAANSCMLSYDWTANQVNLLNDQGSAWMLATPGGGITLQNSQCALNMAATSVTLNGNTLTLNLAIAFKPAYLGGKNIYMYAGDISGPNSGWQQRGTWTVADTQAPTTPGNLNATAVGTTQINLSWSASSDNIGVTGYRVERCPGSACNNFAEVATPAATSYNDIGLAAGTSYSYRVRAADAALNLSGYSNVASATTSAAPDTQAPSTPGNLNASAVSATQINLSWSASTDNVGVTGYKVARCQGSGCSGFTQIATPAGTSYQDSGLTPNTTYNYTVSANDAAGNTSAPSTPAAATTLPSQTGPAYPLKQSANHRYLVDQNNVPFLMAGDSPQALFVNISLSDADLYFANRKAAGINTVWINLLCVVYTGGRADGSTFDGIIPFTTPNDLSTPNEAYFARADAMIQLAANYGIVVLLDPIETGGWTGVLSNNGLTKARDYGRYLGNRYKNFDNVLWMSGNDFQGWTDPVTDQLVRTVAEGIQEMDTRHIHTVELNYFVSGSLDDSSWAPIISFDAAYTYFPTYAKVLEEYNRAALPTFMVEANYELEQNFNDFGSPAILRRQEYWTMLSGAFGQLFGNHFTWQFLNGWQTQLDTKGSAQYKFSNDLFKAFRWYDLVPDQNHTIVTAGYGTFSSTSSLGSNDYATVAGTADGTLVMAYMPTSRTITVQMSKLAGSVTARWYDPGNGTFLAISGSPFANSGTRQFTPPGNNSDGDGDWVLVLTTP